MLMQNMEDDDMKKRAFILVGILFSLVLMSACNSNSNTAANENEVTVIQVEYPVYDTAEEIVNASDLVFSGTVTEINFNKAARWKNGWSSFCCRRCFNNRSRGNILIYYSNI